MPKRRRRQSRTLYNGPFVLSDYDRTDSYFRGGSTGDLKNSHLHSENQLPWSQLQQLRHSFPGGNLAFGQPGHRGNQELESSFVSGESSCQPVYSLSFLDESSSAGHHSGCRNTPAVQFPSCKNDRLSIVETDFNNNVYFCPHNDQNFQSVYNLLTAGNDGSTFKAPHDLIQRFQDLHIQDSEVMHSTNRLSLPNDRRAHSCESRPVSRKNQAVATHGSSGGNFYQPVAARWRKATHGYVCEYATSSDTNTSSVESQESKMSFTSSSSATRDSEERNKIPTGFQCLESSSFSSEGGESRRPLSGCKPELADARNQQARPWQFQEYCRLFRRMGDPFRRDPRKRPINPNFHRYPGGTAPKQFRGPRGRARFPPPRDIERDRYYPAGRITPPFPPPFLDPYDDPRFPLPPPLPPFDDPYFPLPPPCIYDDPYDVPPLLPPLLPRPRRGSPPLLFPDHKLHVDSRRSPEDHCGQPPLEHNNQDFTEDIDLTQIDAKRKAGPGRENGVPRGRGQVRGRGHSAIQGRPAGRGQLGFRGQSVDEDQGQSSGRDQTGVVGQPAIRGQFAGRGRGHMALGGQAQQGRPENVRGRGRGRGGGQSVKKPVAPMSVPVAPVNSMALVGDVANSSTAEKLQKFILKLKDFPEKENSIQTIENCITASHLSLKTQFNVEDVDTQILNRPIFSGTLYINDVFIARATSTGKKLLKHSVFDSALQLLKTRSVAEIMAQADTGPSVEHIREPTFQSPKVEMGEDDLRTKLLKLQNKIRTSKQPDNQPVMLLDVAFLESRCGLTHNCEVEPMRTERGIHLYTKAKVIIEGKLIASAVALSKKESKARAYQKTVDLFLNLEVDSILKEHFYKEEPKEEIPLEIQELIKKHKEKQLSQKPPAALTEQEVGDLLDRLISDLASQPRDGVNTIMNVDKNVVQMKIKLLAVYKIVRSPEFYISCDLYIVDRFIAQGKGTTRRQAQIDAYVKGAEILKKSKGSDVLTSFPKFDDAELKRTDIMDIVYKGYAKTFESNLCRLNRLKQLPEDKRKVSELIIIEHSDWVKDRMKHAHCILNQSATQCGCLLEWTTEPEGVCFRCTMKLQGVQLTTAVARTRKHALAVASSIALFKFYETQPVIQGFHTDYPKVWITREDILRIAQDLPDCSSITPEISADAKQQVDPKLALAIEKKLDQFFSQPTVEDFVAAPDWKLEEKRHLRHMASTRNLRVTSEIFCEEQLTVVCKKHDLLQMLNILEQQPNKCQGRYRILPNEEKPSYNDITGEIAANESLVKQFQGGADLIEKDKQAGVECLEDDMEIENDNENEMNLSVNSEDDDAFVTANNTFVEDKPVAKTTICTTNTTPTFTLSDIPLPKSTSTPSRTPGTVNNGGPVQKGVSKSQKSKSSSRWDKTSSKPKPGKSTTKNTTTDNNNHATTVFPHRNQPLPSPPALAGYSPSPTSLPGSNTGTPSSVIAEPERRPSDPSSARLSEGIWTDSSTYSSPGDQRQFPTADQWLQQQQMQQQQHLQQQAQQQQLQQQQQQHHQQHLPQHQLQHPHSMDGFNAERGQETQSWSQWAGTNYGNQWGQPRQFPIANQNSDIQKQQWIGQQQQQQQHLQQQPQQHLQQPQQLLQQPQQHQQQDFQNGVWTTPGAILGYNNRYSY